MIPILILVVMGGLILVENESRDRILKTGAKPGKVEIHFDLAEEAVRQGDYELAEDEYFKGLALGLENSQVLGVSSYFEDLIWPERKIKREIEVLEEMKKRIKSREIHLRLAVLYQQLGDEAKMSEEIFAAQLIDPNDEQLKEVLGEE